IICFLHQEFSMADLGLLNYVLGVFVTRDSSDLFLSQQKYDVEILEKAYMLNCNHSRTLVDTESKLGVGGDPVCLHMHDPQEPHFSAFKRILRYVQGVPLLGDQLSEAEYRGVANVVAETCWLRNLFRELHTPLSFATLVYCDNVRALHVPSHYQFTNIFTKGHF
nr:hypothetical protein [Tanacetum cinerariifolium]